MTVDYGADRYRVYDYTSRHYEAEEWVNECIEQFGLESSFF